MGRIFQEVKISGSINKNKKLRALFDTGTGANYITRKFLDGSLIYDLGIIEYGKEDQIILPDGSPTKAIKIKLSLLKINGTEPITEPEFWLFNLGKCEMIIGAKLMQKLKIILNPSIKEISFC